MGCTRRGKAFIPQIEGVVVIRRHGCKRRWKVEVESKPRGQASRAFRQFGVCRTNQRLSQNIDLLAANLGLTSNYIVGRGEWLRCLHKVDARWPPSQDGLVGAAASQSE